MSNHSGLEFRIASESWEFEQIHALNHATFVDEIPQHERNENKQLIDKFHAENTYVICVRGRELLGMIALRDKRPLSLDGKLDDLEAWLPPFETILEYRLLAVRKAYRNSAIFSGIMKKAFELAIQGGYDLAVISGTTRQTRLYRHLGFKPFGPLVGTPDAPYQPMYIDVAGATALRKRSLILKSKSDDEEKHSRYNYLPGPVTVAEGVMAACAAPAESHRGAAFMARVDKVRDTLCARVNAARVHILTGSGTLANDIVAAHIALLPGRGLVLVNGEFGKRLRDQATRAGLAFDVVEAEEGDTFDPEMLEASITRRQTRPTWLWAVHCETSTGVLNDIDMLRQRCRQHGLKLCLDGISSIGACAVDLRDVYLATAVSGKGIASLSGLAMVFSRDDLVSGDRRLPGYFDLAAYDASHGVPFTLSSNALHALQAALDNSDWPCRFARIAQWSEATRRELEAIGLSILARPDCRAPHITTIALPGSVPSTRLGEALEAQGMLLSYRSEYLITKNRIQLCLMGECQKPPRAVFSALGDMISEAAKMGEAMQAEVRC